MSYQLNQKLQSCKSLDDALELIESSGQTGTLEVASPQARGFVMFVRGGISAAFIEKTGEQGSRALALLRECQSQIFGFTAAETSAARSGEPAASAVSPGSESASAAAVQGGARPPATGSASGIATVEPPSASAPDVPAARLNSSSGAEPSAFVPDGDPAEATWVEPEPTLIEGAPQQTQSQVEAIAAISAQPGPSQPPTVDPTQLTEEQRILMSILSSVKDPMSFHEETSGLDLNSNESLTAEQRRMLEFYADGKAIPAAEQTFLQNIPTPVVPFERSTRAPLRPAKDEIAAAQTIASDYQRLDEVHYDALSAAPTPEKQPVKPLVDTSNKIDWSKLIGPAVVALMAVGMFTVPAVIRQSASEGDASELSRQQTEMLVREELRNESLTVSKHQRPSSLPPGQNGPAGGGGDSDTSNDPASAVRQARSANDAGRSDKAIQILEATLEANGDATEARIELIKLYKAKRNLKRARELAVIGFRSGNTTPEQHNLFWQLFKECQE
jgi:hypothetical protein